MILNEDQRQELNFLPDALGWNIRFTLVEKANGQGWDYSFQHISCSETHPHPMIRGDIPKPVDRMRAVGIAFAKLTSAIIDDPQTFEQNLFMSEKKRRQDQ